MRTPKFSAFLVLFLASLCQAEPLAKHVILISIDGASPPVLKQAKIPTLLEMAKDGAVSWKAQTVFPSKTLPAHTSMLTSLSPSVHKVSWNNWEARKGFFHFQTIFNVVHAAGKSTAFFAAKDKFRHFDIPGALDCFRIVEKGALEVAEQAAQELAGKKPELMFVHFGDVDKAGHRSGWGSRDQLQAFERVDQAIAKLRATAKEAGIADSTVILVSADHGGKNKDHGSRSEADMTIPWLAWGKSVRKGLELPDPIVTQDTPATALWLLDVARPADWEGKPVQAAFESP